MSILCPIRPLPSLSLTLCSGLPLCLQLKHFKEQNLQVGFGSATLALEQAMEQTRANIRWLAESRGQVLHWLSGEAK